LHLELFLKISLTALELLNFASDEQLLICQLIVQPFDFILLIVSIGFIVGPRMA